MTIFLSSTIPLTYILKESATFRSSHTKEEKDPPSAYQGSQKKSDKMSRTVGTNWFSELNDQLIQWAQSTHKVEKR